MRCKAGLSLDFSRARSDLSWLCALVCFPEMWISLYILYIHIWICIQILFECSLFFLIYSHFINHDNLYKLLTNCFFCFRYMWQSFGFSGEASISWYISFLITNFLWDPQLTDKNTEKTLLRESPSVSSHTYHKFVIFSVAAFPFMWGTFHRIPQNLVQLVTIWWLADFHLGFSTGNNKKNPDILICRWPTMTAFLYSHSANATSKEKWIHKFT